MSAMAKIEIDVLDPTLDNSGDGENDVLGMVDEGSFGSGGDDKAQITTQSFLDSGDDDGYNYNESCPKLAVNTVAYRLVHADSDSYRLVHVGDEFGSNNSTVTTGPVYNTPGGATIERTGTHTMPTVLSNPVNGQLFVISNPNDVYVAPTNKTITPRETNPKTNVKKRDDRRRATHNEVERRRRDKINKWIVHLSKIIPVSQDDKNASESQSKGGILAKACEYILDLKQSGQRLKEVVNDNEAMAEAIIKLNKQVATLTNENTALKNQLLQNGIVPAANLSDIS